MNVAEKIGNEQLTLNSISSDEEMLANEDVRNHIKSLEQQKETLFTQHKVSQEILDVYIGYLPSDL